MALARSLSNHVDSMARSVGGQPGFGMSLNGNFRGGEAGIAIVK
jgi:hypothetical protein